MAIETSPDYNVAIIGHGFVGQAYNKMFPDAIIYDEPRIRQESPEPEVGIAAGRLAVNDCDLAIVSVPTNLVQILDGANVEAISTNPDGTSNLEMSDIESHYELDMSIVEDVIDWIDTPLILIKSALQPGTVDRLVEKTGKNIAVSVEMVGEGKYFVPYWRYPDAQNPTMHNFLIVGGEDETARRCADFLWAKMSPDINIHLTTALEAEITKMMENTWGALKVTFANVMYDICEAKGANYTRVLQAWGADGRTEKMHMRVLPHKRGWKSKCYDKDVPALAALDASGFLNEIVDVNNEHLKED